MTGSTSITSARQDWFTLEAAAVARELDVEPERGLSADGVRSRLAANGPNRLAAAKKESGFQAFVRQYQDFMQIVLLVAAAVNQLVTGDTATTVVLAGLTVFNAVIGLRQEAKAEESVKALSQMMKTIARVRRDGEVIEVDAGDLVPGDIVLVEAGNVVPADGRIFVAATLEIEEAALTGESLPVGKSIEPVEGADVPLGDRTCVAYMNTSVTRGRGEMIVTTTGMQTEIGHIADLLANTEAERTPLQRQLDGLSKIIATIAGIALILVVAIGLIRGDSFDELFITGVALAVAAIPTGLPAVVTALLSIGTREIARRNAIVKRLPAVETLGSTSAICSDKTGTLTLNKMTARELALPGQHRFTVTGEGYSTEGEIRHAGGSSIDLDPYLLPMALCADAVLEGENLIGDPTEGALIVLAAKGRLDLNETRAAYPRVAEVPFDSDYKFMATFHEMSGADGARVVRCYVKGAPDVLIERGGSYRDPDGTIVPITDRNRSSALEANDRMAGSGHRVMVVAQREFDPTTFDPAGDLISLVQDLTLLAMVGIVDPPRAEAKAAIAECAEAGIRVRMITGDHATTAAAIAGELGIPGRAVTGQEFAAMPDEELQRQLPEIGVVARVAPEDKIRLVRLLQQAGNIVAMTGDGVNDAPALKAADIGVAMGITGTEVSKEAAVMILTDDNFATIVGAVEYGRGLYDNLLKYLRFQMSTLVAYIAIFIGAGIFTIAGGIPLNPIQILWLNMVIDIPIAVALGFDASTGGLMRRPPRPVGAPVLSRANWVRLCVQGAVMTVGTLVVYQIGEPRYGALVASTMLLTTLSLFHLAAGLLAREQRNTIFDRDAVPGPTQLRRYGIALLAIIAATSIGFLQRILVTASMTFAQWSICVGIAATLVLVEEVIKLILRRREHRNGPAEPALRISERRSTDVITVPQASPPDRLVDVRFEPDDDDRHSDDDDTRGERSVPPQAVATTQHDGEAEEERER